MDLQLELRVVVSTAQSYEEVTGVILGALNHLNEGNLQIHSFAVVTLNEVTTIKPAEADSGLPADCQSEAMTALVSWGLARELKQRDLAKMCNLHPSYFSGLKTGREPLKLESTRRIITGLRQLDDETAAPILEIFEKVQATLLAQRVVD